MEDAFLFQPEEVLNRCEVTIDRGLSSDQVLKSRERYGSNVLPPDDPTPLWKLILKQFEDQMVLILLAAAAVSLFLAFFEEGEDRTQAFVEPLVIAVILVANATVGVIQETNAEKAIEALKEYESSHATVLRDGVSSEIAASELVIGDIVDVVIGDQIPADIRLLRINSTSLRIDQSILTGESVTVLKDIGAVNDPGAVNQDKKNMLFSGTTVSLGKARGVVVGIGGNTEFGKIRQTIQEADDLVSPMKEKLDAFGELLSKVILVICIVVWLINIGNFGDPSHGGYVKGAVYYFKIAVALAVAAIPEGLPAVVTTCLALGTMRMAKKNAIVRNLPSVETLGCTTIICSDKTGTLTTNRMSVARVMVVESATSRKAQFREFDVEGTSFEPVGTWVDAATGAAVDQPSSLPAVAELASIATLCNDSHIVYTQEGHFDKIGEPTEVALKVMAEKAGIPDPALNAQVRGMPPVQRVRAASDYWSQQYAKLATLEFSRDRKSMSVLVQPMAGAGNRFLVKGAPESILERCTKLRLNGRSDTVNLTPSLKNEILSVCQSYGTGQQTLRVLALAVVDDAPNLKDCDFTDPRSFASYESNMTFVGLAGMLDPPRIEVASSIETCHRAGVRVMVITGDNQATAEAICRRIGVFDPDEDTTGLSFTGREFERLTPTEQEDAVRHARLFCRVEPVHKMRLVTLLQGQGEVVAMTGDGVNDAPALKQADIGVAMGSGTDVAKGSAGMVLADDNFSTIVAAVEEGRAIYTNTKQFIRYLISSNIGEVFCIFLTAFFGMPEALIPVQLLWVNFVTDGFPATALGFNPTDKNIMRQMPRGRDDPIISSWQFFRYFVIGAYVGVATVAAFAWWYMFYEQGPQITWHQLTHFHDCANLLGPNGCDIFKLRNGSTMSLSVLVMIEMLNALNSLSENQSILTIPPWRNMYLIYAIVLSLALHFAVLYVPFLATIFQTTPLNSTEWVWVMYLSLPVIVIDELMKAYARTAHPDEKVTYVSAADDVAHKKNL